MKTTKERLIERIQNEFFSKNKIDTVYGAFGDVEDCEGYLEKVIESPEGGRMSKFWGCSYLFKGNPTYEMVEGIGFGKAFFSRIPREIIAASFVLGLAMVFLLVFARKRLVHYARVYFGVVCGELVKKAPFDSTKQNTFTRELRRSIDKEIDEELIRIGRQRISDGERGDLISQGAYLGSDSREECELIANAAEFLYLFLEYDNAYRFRFQDILECLNKDNLRRHPTREIIRLFDILREREYNINQKWDGLRRIVVPMMVVSPTVRRWVVNILSELDLTKVMLDEDDWYFCLNRHEYDFRGIPYAMRLEERKRVDKEKKHYRILLYVIENRENGGKMHGVKVVPFWEDDKQIA
jgi:hypothetical protein